MIRTLVSSFLLLFGVLGCASAPAIVELREDPRVVKLLENKPAQVPYRLCVGLVKHAFDPAELNKEQEEKHFFAPEAQEMRKHFLSALETSGIFKEVQGLPLRPGAEYSEMLQTAYDKDFDLLVDFEIKKCCVSFEGNTGWYIPNLGLWFYLMVPSWWVRDETYKLEMEIEARFHSVHSERQVHRASFRVAQTRNLDDFQRGWSLFGIFTVPGSLKESNWKKIYEKLQPQVTREAEIALMENTLTEFMQAACATEFRSAMEKTLAVVVGLSSYKDRNIPNLQYAAEDALGVHAFFIDENGGGILKKHALLLRNERATKQSFTEAITGFLRKKARPWDRVVLYFSGYGATVREPAVQETSENDPPADSDKPGPAAADFYLTTYDTVMGDIGKTAVSISALDGFIDSIRARECILIFDTSFSSELPLRALTNFKGLQGDPLDDIAGSGNRAVMASCRLGEGALEVSDLRHGIFTFYLLEGLGGKADSNKDDTVTVKEAYDYLSRRVILESAVESYPQQPVLKGKATGVPLVRFGSR